MSICRRGMLSVSVRFPLKTMAHWACVGGLLILPACASVRSKEVSVSMIIDLTGGTSGSVSVPTVEVYVDRCPNAAEAMPDGHSGPAWAAAFGFKTPAKNIVYVRPFLNGIEVVCEPSTDALNYRVAIDVDAWRHWRGSAEFGSGDAS